MKSKTYDEFVEKFKPKLTTDDCATPPLVYNAILGWVCKEYGVEPAQVVRPFWPGQDYTAAEYPEGCVVVDNPPFSILSKICAWYLDRGIKFFLFAPSLTALSGKDICLRMNHLICDADIRYENGAVVRTAFVTNLGDGETVLQTAPELGAIVKEAVKKLKAETVQALPRYRYPSHLVTAALLQRYAHYGVEFSVKRSECVRVSALDAQREQRKAVYGGGLLLSDDAARRHELAEYTAVMNAGRIAAEREKMETQEWALSDRELAIVQQLSKDGAE